jgi:hypothetical protein
MFKNVSFSVEFKISFPKSSPFRLGKLAKPSSTNSFLESASIPAEVTYLQKFI